jgi:hypothetical protein
MTPVASMTKSKFDELAARVREIDRDKLYNQFGALLGLIGDAFQIGAGAAWIYGTGGVGAAVGGGYLIGRGADNGIANLRTLADGTPHETFLKQGLVEAGKGLNLNNPQAGADAADKTLFVLDLILTFKAYKAKLPPGQALSLPSLAPATGLVLDGGGVTAGRLLPPVIAGQLKVSEGTLQALAASLGVEGARAAGGFFYVEVTKDTQVPAPATGKPVRPNPNLSPTKVTPDMYGLKSVAENQKALELYNQTLRELAASKFPGGNAYQRYLQKIEDASKRGVAPEFTHKEVNDAFKSVSENYQRRLRSNGLLGADEAAELHHWNFNKTDFPGQIADPRNLYLIKGTQAEVDALHKTIHQATSGSSHIWKGPVHPDHVIPLQPLSPYTPPR